MNASYKWTGPRPAKSFPAYARKKDMPSPLLGYLVERIDFGIHGLAYVYMLGESIVSPGGNIPVFRARLTTPGRVIGLRLDDAAKHKPWSEEWRATYHERNLDKMGL